MSKTAYVHRVGMGSTGESGEGLIVEDKEENRGGGCNGYCGNRGPFDDRPGCNGCGNCGGARNP